MAVSFYRWAVSGWVHPRRDLLEPEARRLLDLRYRLSAMVADRYCADGFTTVVQDHIFGEDVTRWLDKVEARARHLVVLRPSIASVAARDAARQTAIGKVAYRPGEHTIEDLDSLVDQTPRLGLWLDTAEQTAEETVGRSSLAALKQMLTGLSLYLRTLWICIPLASSSLTRRQRFEEAQAMQVRATGRASSRAAPIG